MSTYCHFSKCLDCFIQTMSKVFKWHHHHLHRVAESNGDRCNVQVGKKVTKRGSLDLISCALHTCSTSLPFNMAKKQQEACPKASTAFISKKRSLYKDVVLVPSSFPNSNSNRTCEKSTTTPVQH